MYKVLLKIFSIFQKLAKAFQVVRLNSEYQCAQFLCVLSKVLNQTGKQLIIRRCPNSYIVEMAETSERRQEKLDHFFREAYAKVITAYHL